MMVNKELSDEICNKISSRIPQRQQIARSQFRKQFKKWLLGRNNERIVHFMSKKGLEELAGSKNVTLRSPNYSIDRLVSILSSAIAHSTPTLSTEEQTIEVKKAVTRQL